MMPKKSAVGTYQGKYTPINPHKCLNTAKYGSIPIWRSSWEVRVFKKLDESTNCIWWGSEIPDTIVEYPHPFKKDNDDRPKTAHYHPDIFMKIRTSDGSVKVFLVEIKPLIQSVKPNMSERKTKSAMKSYYRNLASYILNSTKWHFANLWCKERGYQFKVLTEAQILNL